MKRPSLISILPHRKGFSLVEMLVSMAILGIIMLTLGNALSYVSRLWANGIGFLDNYTKARDILTIMDRDIQEMVLRPDTAAFADNNGNPACAFYTSVLGNPGGDTRTVSLVQYLINPTGGSDISSETTLARVNLGMNYGSSTPFLGTAANPTPTALTQLPAAGDPNSNTNADALATGVLRFQWQFVDGSGTILNPPYTPSSGTGASTPFAYDFSAPSAPYNPRAIILSLVVLSNPASQLAATNPAILSKLQTDFPVTMTATPPISFSQYWDSILNPGTGSFDATLPAVVQGGVEVFERTVPLPINAP